MQASEQKYEALCTEDATLIIVAFGSSGRIALDALYRARKENISVGLFRPISLWPFPGDALRSLAHQGDKRFLVFEANNGQMLKDVELALCAKAEVNHYGIGGGHIFSPAEIYSEIKRWYK